METLYWITILGNIGVTCTLLAMFLTLVLIITIVCVILREDNHIFKSFMKWELCAFILLTLLRIFIPSKQDLYIIYGVGTTLDYLKDNPQAKQLPDKCIKAIDKYLDNVNEVKVEIDDKDESI